MKKLLSTEKTWLKAKLKDWPTGSILTTLVPTLGWFGRKDVY
jgi:hypothetical protein